MFSACCEVRDGFSQVWLIACQLWAVDSSAYKLSITRRSLAISSYDSGTAWSNPPISSTFTSLMSTTAGMDALRRDVQAQQQGLHYFNESTWVIERQRVLLQKMGRLGIPSLKCLNSPANRTEDTSATCHKQKETPIYGREKKEAIDVYALTMISWYPAYPLYLVHE